MIEIKKFREEYLNILESNKHLKYDFNKIKEDVMECIDW